MMPPFYRANESISTHLQEHWPLLVFTMYILDLQSSYQAPNVPFQSSDSCLFAAFLGLLLESMSSEKLRFLGFDFSCLDDFAPS